jgi:hypothetical protein
MNHTTRALSLAIWSVAFVCDMIGPPLPSLGALIPIPFGFFVATAYETCRYTQHTGPFPSFSVFFCPRSSLCSTFHAVR